MGAIKAKLMEYQDAHGIRYEDIEAVDQADFWDWLERQGGRLGWTDEQMDEVDAAQRRGGE